MSNELTVDHGWRVWWKLTRPHTLTASFAPVLLGTLIALTETSLNWGLFIAMMVASLFIQAATNMFNEYYDFKRGLDNEKSVGIAGAIVRNGVKPSTVLLLAFVLYFFSLLLGIYICNETTWMLAVVGIISMAVGYYYTGGPYPIAYTPFGELFSGFFMGMLIVLISYFIQTNTISTFAILLSVPSMLLVAAIMLANNIRDIVGDKENGRKTMAILVGRDNAISVLASFFIISYLWIIVLVVMQVISPWALLVLVSFKKPLQAVKVFRAYENPLEVNGAMKNTAITNTLFDLLLAVGLAIAIMF